MDFFKLESYNLSLKLTMNKLIKEHRYTKALQISNIGICVL